VNSNSQILGPDPYSRISARISAKTCSSNTSISPRDKIFLPLSTVQLKSYEYFACVDVLPIIVDELDLEELKFFAAKAGATMAINKTVTTAKFAGIFIVSLLLGLK